MAQTIEVVVFVMVDEDGNAVATLGDGDSRENLADLYDEQIGAGTEVARRVVKVVLTVPIPEPVVLSAELPADKETLALTVKAVK